MKREKLEHLTKAGIIERKRSRVKEREKILHILTKWLKAIRVTDELKALRE